MDSRDKNQGSAATSSHVAATTTTGVANSPVAPSGEPRVQVFVQQQPAFVTTLREWVGLVAMTDDESQSLIAGDRVVVANGWTVELVKECEVSQ